MLDKQEALVPVNSGSMTRANTDEMLIRLFLGTKSSPNTRLTYETAIAQFLAFVGGRTLASITLDDLVEYKEHTQVTFASAHTRKLKLNAIKSLLSFAVKVGYVRFNVGAAIEAEKAGNRLAERILSEAEVLNILNTTKKLRDRLVIQLLYASGGRVSEIANLKWKDVKQNGESGQITVVGKGNVERAILLSKKTFGALMDFKPFHSVDVDFVFLSQRNKAEKNGLDSSAIWRIVKNAGERVGLDNVSPHFFRHSHASHALDRGASIVLVKDTLGHANIATTNGYLHAKPNDSSALHLAV